MPASRNIRAGRAFVELYADDNRFVRDLRRAEKRLRAFGARIRSIGTKLTLAGAAMAAPLAASLKIFASMGDQLDKMSKRTGFTAEALSELGFAAEQSGADIETLEKGIKTMQRSINDAGRGLSTATDALGDLGLTFEQLQNLTPEQQFKLIADRLSGISDPTKRAALAMQLFGRSGQKLLPLLMGGSKGMQELQKQARELGLTISSEDASAAAEMTDAMNRLWKSVKVGIFSVGAALAPALTRAADLMTKIAVRVSTWIKENRRLVVIVAAVTAGVLATGAALVALGIAVSLVGAALGGLAAIVGLVTAAITAMGTVLAAIVSPIGLVIGAVAALGAVLAVNSKAGGSALDWLGGRFNDLKDGASDSLGGIRDALAAGDYALAAKILWLSLKVAWEEGTSRLMEIWRTLWYGGQALFEEVSNGIEIAWIETTSFLSKTWSRFTGGFKKIWQTATSFVSKRILEIQGLFDKSLDVKAAKKGVDEELKRKLSEIDTEAQQKIKEREEKRQRAREQAQKEHEATMSKIAEKDASSVAESKKDLEKAKQALKDALQAAHDERNKKPNDAGPAPEAPKTPADAVRNALAGIDQVMTGVKEKTVSVVGTFNAAALRGLAGPQKSADRTAKATEETAKNTRRLIDEAKTGGLTFS